MDLYATSWLICIYTIQKCYMAYYAKHIFIVECRNLNILNRNYAKIRTIDRSNRSSSDFGSFGLFEHSDFGQVPLHLG